jgi:ethanolamine utilization protein EutA (predicted chaperonin)
MGVINDEFRGVLNIPLNRLKELPEDIVENIEPVFFNEENWYINENCLFVLNKNNKIIDEVFLHNIESQAFVYFKYGKKLKQIAIEIKERNEMAFEEIYKRVTCFFFTLASLRICHPKDVYNVDEIVKANSLNQI